MPTPTRRGSDTPEKVITMADYQRAINQSIHWPHLDEDGRLEPVAITDLHPARATNALHKLRRWHHTLFDGATEAIYEQAKSTLYASPLVGALIEAALGEFYTGTYLSEAVPHVDEIAQRRETQQMNELGQARLKDALMVIAIDTLDDIGGASLSFGQRAVLLRDRMYDYLTKKEN